MTAPLPYVIVVYGDAAPQGALKAGVRRDGRVFLRHRDRSVREWRGMVAQAAGDAMGDASPLQGPVAIDVRFYRTRPAGHYGRRGLRPSAPQLPSTRPDLDKLLRAVLDGLQGVCFLDDAQVSQISACKLYADDAPARTEITVRPVHQPVPDQTIDQLRLLRQEVTPV